MRVRQSICFVTLTALVLFLGVIFTFPQLSAAAGETAVVTGEVVNIRSGPGTGFNILLSARKGERFQVLDKSGDWVGISLPSGSKGWVAGWLVNIEQQQASIQEALVSTSYINVRSGPGTNYNVISQAGNGERLPVIEKSGDWLKIRLSTGATGWVAGWLVVVQTTGSSPANPSVPSSSETAQAEKIAVVSGSSVNVRSGPGTTNGIVGQVVQGDSLAVLEQSGEWYRVKLSNGGTGWIAGWLVSIKQATVTPSTPSSSDTSRGGGRVAVVTGSVVNVRSGPGTSSGIVGQAYQGNNLPVMDQSGEWFSVKLSNGGTGWIAGWLVSVNTPAPVIPATPVTPTTPEQPETPVTPTAPGSSGVVGQAGKALSLEINDVGDKTSTVVETDVSIEYTSFFLKNPDRLVIDLKDIAPGTLPLSTDVNSKTVNKVRTGYFQREPDITRLVIELSGGAQYVASLSGDQKKLTVQTYIPEINYSSYKGKVIVIDPGHGGAETGATGKNGTKEKAITLDVAKRVARLLEAQGAKVIMTRTGDQTIGLYERTDKANQANASVFVSIHINANEDSSYGGTSTYIYSGKESSQAARVQESRRLAGYVQTELLRSLGLRDVGIKEANFVVLRTSDMPSILTELAFISNLNEEKLINTDDFKNKAAEAIVRGIGLYLSEKRSA